MFTDKGECLVSCVADEAIHEQIHIENNSTGHDYHTVFSRCVDHRLTAVEIEDPYIRSHHQVTDHWVNGFILDSGQLDVYIQNNH